MREIHCDQIIEVVSRLCIQACLELPDSVLELIRQAKEEEPYAPARDTLSLLCSNAAIAKREALPICQDTGMAVVYAKIGQDVHIVGGLFEEAVNAGVRKGYTEGYLRKSVVKDPIRRGNTNDNTPAVLHISLVPGNKIELTVAPKGFGSENMSRLAMLTPAQGEKGVFDFVVETAKLAGANPCPPMILGVGIGGDFEQVAALAKRALVEERTHPHPDPYYEELEQRMLSEINALNIGPQGFGGKTTALRVHILAAPTHIAGLPVAVNVGCHVTRHAHAVL